MRIAHAGAPYLDSRVVAARLNGRVCPSVQPGWVSAQRFPASTGAGAVSGCGSPSRQRPARFLAASAAAGASKEVAAEPQASQKRPAAGAAAAEQRADAVTASDSPPLAGEHTQGPELNWKAGAALAGASFEAYCSAEERGIPERHACGAEVYYVDKEFVRTKLAGLLQVAVRRAVSPPAAEARSALSPGPQLRLSVGWSSWSSIVAVNNSNPDWEEQCTLYIRSPGEQALQVQVWDPGSGVGPTAADDCTLGCASVELSRLCDGQTHELDLELSCSTGIGAGEGGEGAHPGSGASGDGQGPADTSPGRSTGDSGEQQPGEPCGSVQLRCRFFSFEEALAQGAAADSEMGPPVVGTPGQIPLADDWREVLELAGVTAHTMFKPVAYIENTTTDTEAWVYWNKEQAAACVAFRGTEQGKWRDILTDLHLVPAPLDPDRVAQAPEEAALAEVSQPPEEPGQLWRILSTVEQAKAEVAAQRAQQEQEQSCKEQAERHILATAAGAVVSAAEDLKAVLDRVLAEVEAAQQRDAEEEAAGTEPQPWVHSGFLTAYDSVRPAVLSTLSTLLQGEAPRSWRLFLTGHSLGGALATLCAWDCAHRSWPVPVELEVWNFGCPRVGNRAFAQHYNHLVPSTWRVVNARDTVCTLPRLMGYAHVGHAIHLEPDGSVELIMHSTQRVGEGVSLPDVAPAVSAVVASTVASKVPDLVPEALEKMPELLPGAATAALKKVGLEVAAAGSLEEDPEAAGAAAAATISAAFEDVADVEALLNGNGAKSTTNDGSSSNSSSSSNGTGATSSGGPPELSPEHLGHLWEEERAAWSLLFDGALDPHMEPQYLAGMRALLEAKRRDQPG